MTPEVLRLVGRIGEKDRALAQQVRESWPSVVLNIAEGSGSRAGNRRLRYENALSSVREALATLEYSAAAGYIEPVGEPLLTSFNHIIGVLVRNVYPAK